MTNLCDNGCDLSLVGESMFDVVVAGAHETEVTPSLCAANIDASQVPSSRDYNLVNTLLK